MRTILLTLLLLTTSFAQIDFDTYFNSYSLRIDYAHVGTSESDNFYVENIIQEPYYGGSKTKLIDPFNYGMFKVEVYDKESDILIYSRTYSSLFGEWQTTEEANRMQRSFPETVTVPYPKKDVTIKFFSRNDENEFVHKTSFDVDPSDILISKEQRADLPSFDILINGEPENKVDIVIVPDGYTMEELDKFQEDAKRIAGHLFNASPYKENVDRFNVRGVLAPSRDSGPDIPGEDVWKNTAAHSSFYTFGVERYMTTPDLQAVSDIAANVPYDQIVILVNTQKYGGGGIYNFYTLTASNNSEEEYLMVHEFSHTFAFLADEYYSSEVAYVEWYKLDLEPLEPNITTLVDFESKWKDMLDTDTPVPTPVEKQYESTVGVYEGGGYTAKGVYRPWQACQMNVIANDALCPVCRRAIEKMIDLYAE